MRFLALLLTACGGIEVPTQPTPPPAVQLEGLWVGAGPLDRADALENLDAARSGEVAASGEHAAAHRAARALTEGVPESEIAKLLAPRTHTLEIRESTVRLHQGPAYPLTEKEDFFEVKLNGRTARIELESPRRLVWTSNGTSLLFVREP